MNIGILKKINNPNRITFNDLTNYMNAKKDDDNCFSSLALLITDEYVGIDYYYLSDIPSGAKNLNNTAHNLSQVMFVDFSINKSAKYGENDLFIKAKGQLYLDEYNKDKKNKRFTIFIAILSSSATAILTALCIKLI